jgi:hypothetical protein
VSGRSSGSGSTSSDSSVAAALSSVKALRTSAGTRRLRLTVTSSEAVKAVARLTRSGKTLLKTGSRSLAAGQHSFKVTIPSSVRSGAATLRVAFKDAAGNSKTATRTVHVAKRR